MLLKPGLCNPTSRYPPTSLFGTKVSIYLTISLLKHPLPPTGRDYPSLTWIEPISKGDNNLQVKKRFLHVCSVRSYHIISIKKPCIYIYLIFLNFYKVWTSSLYIEAKSFNIFSIAMQRWVGGNLHNTLFIFFASSYLVTEQFFAR
jgi:hypothetical protein